MTNTTTTRSDIATPIEVQRRFVDGFQNDHDVAVGEALLAHDFVNHSPFVDLPPDREGVLVAFAALWEGFPDLRAEVHQMLCDGDLVTTRKTFIGTNTGSFMGQHPTGRAVEFDVIDIVRIRDGQLVEHWNVIDLLTLFSQLGMIPG